MVILKNIKELDESFTPFEVSTENSVSIQDFILLAKKITDNKNTKLNFGAIPYRENELMDCKTDISNLKALGWLPKFTLEEGLQLLLKKKKRLYEIFNNRRLRLFRL